MSKLFVITFKRPSINLEKAIYGQDFTHSYDCEAFGSEEIANSKFQEYKSNPDYSDVDMFECEDFRYVEFCKMEDAYVHFAKTGEHSMKPVDDLDEGYQPPYAIWVLDGDDNKWKPWGGNTSGEFDKDDFLAKANRREFPNETFINNYIDAVLRPNDGTSPEDDIHEEVEVGTEQHTLTIPVALEMARYAPDVSFDYNIDIDDVGQIVITPIDTGASIINIDPISEPSDNDVIDGDTRNVSITITANLISDDGNYSYFMDVDEVGQAVITPESEATSFLSASVNGSLNLITDGEEITEGITLDKSDEDKLEDNVSSENQEEEPEKMEVEVKVVKEDIDEDGPYSREQIEQELKSITSNFTREAGDIKCGYEEEHNYAMEILSRVYECEAGKEGDWFTIRFWKV